MPESKSGALPLGDSPSKPLTISFCGEIVQGMTRNRARVNEPRALDETARFVVRFRQTIVDPLQELPALALVGSGGAPRLGRRRKGAIDDAEDRRSRARHARPRQCGALRSLEGDRIERAQRGADRALA